MSEQPIIFCDELLHGVLSGKVTMTWRVLTKQPTLVAGRTWEWPYKSRHDEPGPCKPMSKASWAAGVDPSHGMARFCPYGGPGDVLWIKEAWQCFHGGTNDVMFTKPRPSVCSLDYRATNASHWPGPWRHPWFMPKWASRPERLIIDAVCCRRIQGITEEEARLCGCIWRPSPTGCTEASNVAVYRDLYDRLNAARGHPWAANDWCWGIRFRAKAQAEIMEARDASSRI